MNSNRLLIIDGNSIMNRAFYGIMNTKSLMSANGVYTNAIYGFLAILFKELEDLNPEYIAVAFDLKAPTHRHIMYKEYKGTRHAMPEELAQQMPIIKEILNDMNITIIEKEGFEADDIIGTVSKLAEKEGHVVTILSGDRDNFQLASNNITIRIPRTKMGKTETEDYNEDKIKEEYGITPIQLIQVKGLMGDTSDNIPGVPGVGEKTALKLIKEYENIDKLYKNLENGNSDIKGALKQKLENNKELALLSRTLGTILLDAPIGINIEDLKTKEWNKDAVANKFKELRFNRFIERFDLNKLSTVGKEKKLEDLFKIKELNLNKKEDLDRLDKEIKNIYNTKEFIYYLEKEEILNNNAELNIINKREKSITFYNKNTNTIFYIPNFNLEKENKLALIFNEPEIEKNGYKVKSDIIILKELGKEYNNIKFDTEIAGYNLNPTAKNTLEEMAKIYLDLDIEEYLEDELKGKDKEQNNAQMNLFDIQEKNNAEVNQREKYENAFYCYIISKLKEITTKKLTEAGTISLFNNIEMPLVQVLADMQYNGMYVDKQELKNFGDELKKQLQELTTSIYQLAGEEFNINSHQQLGKILFEKLKLPVYKKTKNGYTTDVEVLEKLKSQHPIIEKILEYRTLMKLNSTYVEGLIPYINKKTNRIHSSFHQTITATGRISSTEPNLQNIPTRQELGRQIRKAFKPAEGKVYIDADYSQIELRVLAHISEDENMIQAFNNGEDIHKQAASKVFNIPIEEVTKEQRSSAKAVNFGIVYGISDFGLANQLGVSNKKAKEYIEQYLNKYNGIKQFMDNIVESAKEKGYVETLFGRRRYIPEIKSNNYMVRQFGNRVAMNTPIQGTAADIMKIAMINVYKTLKENKINAKIVLQIHDELLLEVSNEDKEKAKDILKNCMENAIKLVVPLEVEISYGNSWYEVK